MKRNASSTRLVVTTGGKGVVRPCRRPAVVRSGRWLGLTEGCRRRWRRPRSAAGATTAVRCSSIWRWRSPMGRPRSATWGCCGSAGAVRRGGLDADDVADPGGRRRGRARAHRRGPGDGAGPRRGRRAWTRVLRDRLRRHAGRAHSEKEGAAADLQARLRLLPADGLPRRHRRALAGLLRPGNAGSGTAADHVEVLDVALAQLPVDPTSHEVIARADSAGCSHDFFDACRSASVRFVVGHALSRASPRW